MFEICCKIIKRQRDGKCKPDHVLKIVRSGDRYVPAGSICLSFYICKCLKFSIIKINPKGKKKQVPTLLVGVQTCRTFFEGNLPIKLNLCISVDPVIPKSTEALAKEPKTAWIRLPTA